MIFFEVWKVFVIRTYGDKKFKFQKIIFPYFKIIFQKNYDFYGIFALPNFYPIS
jgi:hypothetical protein